MDLKEEAIIGPAVASHWYYVSKGRALSAFLGDQDVGEILDVGAGSGIFTRQLLDAGLARRGVCVDTGYAADRVESRGGYEIQYVRHVDDVTQDLILMMDVLEHVDDDVGLLREYSDRMPRTSRVLITVPAFEFIWSGHDVFLEHRRRYTIAAVERLVRRANLRVVKSRYFFGIVFPLVAVVRLFDRVRLGAGAIEAKSGLNTLPPLINTVLTNLHRVEQATLFKVNRAAGLSVFCLAARA